MSSFMTMEDQLWRTVRRSHKGFYDAESWWCASFQLYFLQIGSNQRYVRVRKATAEGLSYMVESKSCADYMWTGAFAEDYELFLKHCSIPMADWAKFSTTPLQYFLCMHYSNHCVALLSEVVLLFKYLQRSGAHPRFDGRQITDAKLLSCIYRTDGAVVATMWEDGYVESHPKPTIDPSEGMQGGYEYLKAKQPVFAGEGPHEYIHYLLQLKLSGSEDSILLVDLLPISLKGLRAVKDRQQKKRQLVYRIVKDVECTGSMREFKGCSFRETTDPNYVALGSVEGIPLTTAEGEPWEVKLSFIQKLGEDLMRAMPEVKKI